MQVPVIPTTQRRARRQGFIAPIEQLTEKYRVFHRVRFTSDRMQLALRALRPEESIGSETHATHDRFFRIEKSKGRIRIDPGDAIVVPAGGPMKPVLPGRP